MRQTRGKVQQKKNPEKQRKCGVTHSKPTKDGRREENSLQKQWEAEQPGEKRHGSEVGDIFKKEGTADCIEQR